MLWTWHCRRRSCCSKSNSWQWESRPRDGGAVLDDEKGRPMGDGTSARLDTVDIADSSGWHVESTTEVDIFIQGGHRIDVHYTDADLIDSASRHSENGDCDSLGRHTEAKVEQLRSWLT